MSEDISFILNAFGYGNLDKRCVNCDICGESGKSSKGGYFVKRIESNTDEAICEKCFLNFVIPENPILDTELKNIAFKHGIGRNYKKEDTSLILDKDKSFEENIMNIRSNKNYNISEELWNIEKKKEGINILVEINKGSQKRMCNECGKINENLPKCSKCKLVYYCNKYCQNKNWEKHKKECKQRN